MDSRGLSGAKYPGPMIGHHLLELGKRANFRKTFTRLRDTLLASGAIIGVIWIGDFDVCFPLPAMARRRVRAVRERPRSARSARIFPWSSQIYRSMRNASETPHERWVFVEHTISLRTGGLAPRTFPSLLRPSNRSCGRNGNT
jgi:hypothetical protein